jgi:Adenylosuccinate synthetase
MSAMNKVGTKVGRNVVVVGTQWGDEGKGKLVDWLDTMLAIPWSSTVSKRRLI